MNRRNFIRGALGLAALAAAGPLVSSPKTVIDRILEKAKTGLIEYETFYLDEPIVFEYQENLTIRNCQFIMTKPMNTAIIVRKNTRLQIYSCHFDGKLCTGSLINFESAEQSVFTNLSIT